MSRAFNNKLPMLVGVYGSLRKGLHNHRLISRCEPVQEIRIPNLELFSLGSFPCVLPSKAPCKGVVCEVYRVHTQEQLNALDGLEGHPDWYRRTVYSTPLGDVQVYVMQDEEYRDNPQVKSGDWYEYIAGIKTKLGV